VYGHFVQVPLVGSGTDPVTDIDHWLAAEPVHLLVSTFAANSADQQLASDPATGHGSAEDRLKRLRSASARTRSRPSG
jgi:hypothetical protein